MVCCLQISTCEPSPEHAFRFSSWQTSPGSAIDVSHRARPSAFTQPRAPRQGTSAYRPPWQASIPALLLQLAAPSSSALHGSPAWLPLKSQLVPFSVRRQPPGPLHGDSMKLPAWQMSSRLASRQRASPFSHELPAEGLQFASESSAIARRSNRVERNCKALSSLALEKARARAIHAISGAEQDRYNARNQLILLVYIACNRSDEQRLTSLRLLVGRTGRERHTFRAHRRKSHGTTYR